MESDPIKHHLVLQKGWMNNVVFMLQAKLIIVSQVIQVESIRGFIEIISHEIMCPFNSLDIM